MNAFHRLLLLPMLLIVIIIVGCSKQPTQPSVTLTDTTPPGTITNLVVASSDSSSIALAWSASGDDGAAGTATSYDLRFSTSLITSGNFASASQVTGEPIPTVAGTSQSMVVSGLVANTTYYFAMKATDEVPNVSALSNVVTAVTHTSSGMAPPAFVLAWGTAGIGDGQFNQIEGLAVDAGGNVYVADSFNNRIQKFTSTGTYLTQWGTFGRGNGQFTGPRGVAVDGTGNVYVSDSDSSNLAVARIQKFTSTGTYLTQWGTFGSGNGQFSRPEGVAVDGTGNVYVVEFNNHRIQKFTSDGTYLTKWGTFGSGNGQFSKPWSVTVDAGGNVYVADFFNNRIQKFTSTGTYLTQWGTFGIGNGQFNGPTGVAVDGNGNVYVSDYFNNRIQKFAPAP